MIFECYFLKRKFIQKTTIALILSLFLTPHFVFTEYNGYFISVGYQLGQATQIAKNTGEIKQLANYYQELQNSLA
ncbi:hypothetical protein [Helicobacter cetorum]|uniref:Outer membrane protein n=1 Tax=Helicobacter cetorum (strain ATCC BAA-540 / CCUG 52418 / MIT 99-5656) TaxID=1163745 RepID=I0ERA4_HELCM|nr:hypothetical protein [Helicobacter cetorum]AFI05473.1 hypothetical protein HCD_02265 [Helicobacter cetorum MIT 99-5656]